MANAELDVRARIVAFKRSMPLRHGALNRVYGGDRPRAHGTSSPELRADARSRVARYRRVRSSVPRRRYGFIVPADEGGEVREHVGCQSSNRVQVVSSRFIDWPLNPLPRWCSTHQTGIAPT